MQCPEPGWSNPTHWDSLGNHVQIHCVQLELSQYKKDTDVLKWVQQHETKVSRGWILKYRLRAESVQPEDDCGQILLLSANAWWVTVEKDRASCSSEMHAKRMKVNRYTVPQEKFWLDIWKIGLVPEWSNTGSSCLERLWNLHLFRYPRGYSSTQLWSRSGLPSGVEFQSSLPN